MDERNFSDINDFCSTAQAEGVSTVILCYTDEWGPSPRENNAVYCGPRKQMLLLTYVKGCIWRCFFESEEADKEIVQKKVASYGLKWELRSRNLAKYGNAK